MTNLILHIGTHKTATTSIQHCCALNRDLLEKFGYFYPRHPASSYVFNALASDVAFGHIDRASAYFKKYADQAKIKNIDTVLMSAESFYSMTGLFYSVHNRPVPDYWSQEEKYIRDVRKMTEHFSNVKIKITFRSQDDLASSLYNQTIKNSLGYSYSYDEFMQKMAPVFDYNRHLELWESAFGKDNISVNLMGNGDAVAEFFSDMLSEQQVNQLVQKKFSSNERLTRDVMETKKIFNATLPDRPLGFVAARIFRELSDKHPDKPGYQIFASLDKRKDFWKSYEPGNNAFVERYALSEKLQVISKADEPTYLGLDESKKREIELKFYQKLNSPIIQIELNARRFARWVSEQGKFGMIIINPLRSANNYLRLRLSGW